MIIIILIKLLPPFELRKRTVFQRVRLCPLSYLRYQCRHKSGIYREENLNYPSKQDVNNRVTAKWQQNYSFFYEDIRGENVCDDQDFLRQWIVYHFFQFCLNRLHIYIVFTCLRLCKVLSTYFKGLFYAAISTFLKRHHASVIGKPRSKMHREWSTHIWRNFNTLKFQFWQMFWVDSLPKFSCFGKRYNFFPASHATSWSTFGSPICSTSTIFARLQELHERQCRPTEDNCCEKHDNQSCGDNDAPRFFLGIFQMKTQRIWDRTAKTRKPHDETHFWMMGHFTKKLFPNGRLPRSFFPTTDTSQERHFPKADNCQWFSIDKNSTIRSSKFITWIYKINFDAKFVP